MADILTRPLTQVTCRLFTLRGLLLRPSSYSSSSSRQSTGHLKRLLRCLMVQRHWKPLPGKQHMKLELNMISRTRSGKMKMKKVQAHIRPRNSQRLKCLNLSQCRRIYSIVQIGFDIFTHSLYIYEALMKPISDRNWGGLVYFIRGIVIIIDRR